MLLLKCEFYAGSGPEVAFVRLPGNAVGPSKPSQEMQLVCRTPACLSLFSDANFHANVCYIAVSLVFVVQRRPERQSLSTTAFLWDQWRDERMRIMNVLYAETVYTDQDSSLTYDTSPDMHTVRSNRISSTQSIPFSFPSAVFFNPVFPFSILFV